MPETDNKETNWFLWSIAASCLIAIACSFYFFYFKQDYELIVEVACDPYEEICFQRDCSNPDDCPSNGFSDFKRYSLNAGDFNVCENEDCTNACETGLIQCEQIECEAVEEFGESCSSVEPTVEE